MSSFQAINLFLEFDFFRYSRTAILPDLPAPLCLSFFRKLLHLESILARPRPVDCNLCVPFTATYLPMGGYAFVSSLDRRLTRRAAAPHVLSQSSRRSVVLSSSPCVLIACFPIILSSQQPSSAGRTGLIGIIVSRPPVSERWAHRCLDCDSTVLVLAGDVSQAKNACRRSKQSPSKNPSSTTGTDTDDVARVLCHSSQLAFPSERHSESVSTVPLRRQASQAAVPVSFLLFIAAITIPISAQVNNHHGSGSRRQEASSINSKPTPLHQKGSTQSMSTLTSISLSHLLVLQSPLKSKTILTPSIPLIPPCIGGERARPAPLSPPASAVRRRREDEKKTCSRLQTDAHAPRSDRTVWQLLVPIHPPMSCKSLKTRPRTAHGV